MCQIHYTTLRIVYVAAFSPASHIRQPIPQRRDAQFQARVRAILHAAFEAYGAGHRVPHFVDQRPHRSALGLGGVSLAGGHTLFVGRFCGICAPAGRIAEEVGRFRCAHDGMISPAGTFQQWRVTELVLFVQRGAIGAAETIEPVLTLPASMRVQERGTCKGIKPKSLRARAPDFLESTLSA